MNAAVDVVGCGEGKDPSVPTLGVAILIAVGVPAAVTGKLKLLPPPPAPTDESKPGVLGGAEGCA